jgi:hypothetical protein
MWGGYLANPWADLVGGEGVLKEEIVMSKLDPDALRELASYLEKYGMPRLTLSSALRMIAADIEGMTIGLREAVSPKLTDKTGRYVRRPSRGMTYYTSYNPASAPQAWDGDNLDEEAFVLGDAYDNPAHAQAAYDARRAEQAERIRKAGGELT